MFKYKNSKKGFSLIELLVVIALMAILGTIGITTYLTQMQARRQEADNSVLTNVETQLKLLFSYENDFEEVKNIITPPIAENDPTLRTSEDNTIYITLVCKNVSSKGIIKMKDTYINQDKTKLLSVECPNLYEDLCDSVGEEINLQYSGYRNGYYEIKCEFDGNRVSDVRNYTISNDSVKITSKSTLTE